MELKPMLQYHPGSTPKRKPFCFSQARQLIMSRCERNILPFVDIFGVKLINNKVMQYFTLLWLERNLCRFSWTAFGIHSIGSWKSYLLLTVLSHLKGRQFRPKWYPGKFQIKASFFQLANAHGLPAACVPRPSCLTCLKAILFPRMLWQIQIAT